MGKGVGDVVTVEAPRGSWQATRARRSVARDGATSAGGRGFQRREEERFAREHPRSRELAADAQRHLLAGVPMHWMAKWPGGFPLFVAEARGSRFTDVDGRSTSTSASATRAR